MLITESRLREIVKEELEKIRLEVSAGNRVRNNLKAARDRRKRGGSEGDDDENGGEETFYDLGKGQGLKAKALPKRPKPPEYDV